MAGGCEGTCCDECGVEITWTPVVIGTDLIVAAIVRWVWSVTAPAVTPAGWMMAAGLFG